LFRCDDLAVLNEVAAAVNRGINVRVVLTRHAQRWKHRLKDLEALLQNMGASVRRYEGPSAKYHAKYIVADDGPAVVGVRSRISDHFKRG